MRALSCHQRLKDVCGSVGSLLACAIMLFGCGGNTGASAVGSVESAADGSVSGDGAVADTERPEVGDATVDSQAPPDAGSELLPEGGSSTDAGEYEPLCDPALDEVQALSLWSDADTVYLMAGISWVKRKLFARSTSEAGWHVVFEGDAGTEWLGIRGRPDGDIFEYGLDVCGIRLIHDGVSTCSAAAGAGPVAAPSNEHAYSVAGHRIHEYVDGEWLLGVALPDSEYLSDVWADQSRALVGGTGLWWWQGGTLAAVDGAPHASYTKVWAAGERVFAGTADGTVLVKDGAAWTEAWASPCHQRVVGIWGQADDVFVLTGRELVRWRQSEIDVLAAVDCGGKGEYRSLWGNAPDQVFVAFNNAGCNELCGCVQMERWNGSTLSPF